MSIIEVVVRLFAPHVCIECGAEEDELLCKDCAGRLQSMPSRCYRCLAPTRHYVTCADCSPHTVLGQVLVRTYYRGASKALVRRLKFDRARAGAGEIAGLLSGLLPYLPTDVVLVHVPTATSRVRARGYDHARLIAHALATRNRLQHRSLLGRVGQARQVGASRSTRLQQLARVFRPIHADAIRGKHVVLIDDVLTTGATLEAAARALRAAGAAHVSAIVFAQA